MITPWRRFAPHSGSTDPSINIRNRLDRIDRSIDWQRFDKYLRYIDPRGERTEGFPPLMLFKALLIQQWYALIASEYDYFLNDSISCRRFIGLMGGKRPPSHLTITGFRLLLADRGVAAEVYAELDRQLTALGLKEPADHASAPERDSGPRFRPLSLCGVQPPPPPEWTELETALRGYWEDTRFRRRMPRLADTRLNEVSEIQPHAALIRLIRETNDFRYEFVGPKVVEGNGSDATGTTVGEKVRYNRRNYGRSGLQSDLAAAFVGAVKHRRPVSISTDFVNANLTRCEMWAAVAPLAGASDDEIEMLVGVALIKPILLN